MLKGCGNLSWPSRLAGKRRTPIYRPKKTIYSSLHLSFIKGQVLSSSVFYPMTGDRRHRWSLPYQRASEEGLKSELELRLESLCGWRRMRAAAPADRRISFRQVPLMRQLADEHDNRTRNKNCRRSCQTRRGRALRHWVHRAGEDRAFEESRKES